MSVDVVLEHETWASAGIEELAERAFGGLCARLKLAPDAVEAVILACNDDRIAALNADFRGKPQPTNVLSWPSADRSNPGLSPEPPEPGELGDIAIAFETCVREARDQGKPLEAHVTHLLVHGLLHLLGYDHETDKDAALMERLEVEILATLGLPDPY